MLKKHLPKSVLGFVMLLISLIGLLKLLMAYLSPMNAKETIQKILASKLDAQTVKFWVAVSAFETAGFTSAVYRKNHNLFGMHLASRNTTAIGSTGGDGGSLAVYATDEDSVKDLLMYFERLKWAQLNFSTIEELVAYMKGKGYTTTDATTYTNGVLSWYRKLFVS